MRAFFAIELDAAAREAAARVARALRERPGGDGVRWVRPEALHVTLRFLGEIDSDRVEPLVARVGEQVARQAPFELCLGPPKLFPGRRRPRVVALGLVPQEPLVELAAAVERGVVAAGLAPEPRPFRGHLTLGRIRGSRFPSPDAVAEPVARGLAVRRVVLFRSDLRPAGPLYTALEALGLGAAAAEGGGAAPGGDGSR